MNIQPTHSKKQEAEKLQRDIDTFLKKKKKIQVIPHGVTCEVVSLRAKQEMKKKRLEG